MNKVEEAINVIEKMQENKFEYLYIDEIEALKIILSELDRLQKLADTDLTSVYMKDFEDGKAKCKEKIDSLSKKLELLKAENEQKDKQIDLMANAIYEEFYDIKINSEEKIKQYFSNLVKGE